MKLYTADRETGTFIDEVESIREGLALIKKYEEADRADGTFEDEFYDIVNEEHESMSEKKFWIDCDSSGGTQFALYEKTEDGDKCILKFDFDDVPGLKELEQAGQIGEAYELIDKYIKERLGFLPEYEVG